MFDTARVDTSLQAKRQHLAAKISEGRSAIEVLSRRHAEMGQRIEMATTAVHELERQLFATDTVIELFDRENLFFVRERPLPAACDFDIPPPPAPAPAPVPIHGRPSQPDGFRPLTYLRCLREGHDMVMSRSMTGKVTCRRCRMRRKI